MTNNDPKCTILIIEDEEPVRFSMTTYLNDLGYQTLEAENGRIGLDVFRKETPDLILLDLRMPEMDGLQVLSVLKVEAPDTPAIVVSGTGKIHDAIETLQSGAWDYVLKPIRDMQVLLHAINKALERARLLLENRRYQENLEGLVKERTAELQTEINERRNVEKALRESEERYRTLIDTAREGVWVIDIDVHTTFLNQQMADMLGYTTEDILGRTMYEFLDDTNAARLKKKLVRRRAGYGEQYDLQFRHKDESKVCCIINASPLFDAEGQVVGSFGMITDVTERQQLRNRLQQAQRMEAIGTLAGGIAHDFNNILGAIIGYSQLMEFDMPEGNSRSHHFLKGVQKAADRAKNLVQQILTFSHQTQEERKPVLLEPLVKESIKFLRATIPTTIEICQHLESKDSVVLADPTQMHQVVMNLCTNAAQAMGNEGGKLEVTMSEVDIAPGVDDPALDEQAGPYIRLAVSDTGKGIQPKDLERIFDPFFTTKQLGEGTGMGLSVVHGIVRNHGGAIRVNSQQGKGTLFEVLLPRNELPPTETKDNKSAALRQGTETILVVDDEESIVDVLEQTLLHLGYTVEAESSSLHALETFRSKPSGFDLVITDMNMPGLTGIKLARELIDIRPDIPIILCTGFCDKITTGEVRSIGIRELLLKPLDTTNLADIVWKVLHPNE